MLRTVALIAAALWSCLHEKVVVSEATQEIIEYLPRCEGILPADSSAHSYCLNGSICRISSAPEDYLRIVCDCSNLASLDYFYAGPRCSTKVMRTYRIQQARNLESTLNLVNTSFLEDILGMNQWKNDATLVGPLVL